MKLTNTVLSAALLAGFLAATSLPVEAAEKGGTMEHDKGMMKDAMGKMPDDKGMMKSEVNEKMTGKAATEGDKMKIDDKMKMGDKMKK